MSDTYNLTEQKQPACVHEQLYLKIACYMDEEERKKSEESLRKHICQSKKQ